MLRTPEQRKDATVKQMPQPAIPRSAAVVHKLFGLRFSMHGRLCVRDGGFMARVSCGSNALAKGVRQPRPCSVEIRVSLGRRGL